MKKIFRLIGVACFGVLVLPFVILGEQDSPTKQATLVEQTKKTLNAVSGKLQPGMPAKDILESLSALRRLTQDLRGFPMQQQLMFL